MISSLMWKTEVIPPALVRGTFVMLYKKGPRDNFGNYRAIGLMCHSYKLLSMLVLHCMQDAVESRLSETQAGFRRERGCRDNVLLLRLMMDAVLRAGKEAVVTFIDYRAAFDTISHRFLDESLAAAGEQPKIRRIVKAIYAEATRMVRLRLPSGETMCSEPFPVRRGVIQSDIFSPQCFTLGLDRIFRLHDIAGQLKIAKVIPLFKKDDPKLLKNYRPISLLPTISKVIEKIIFTQLSTYFNENKLIFDNQYGFRPKHSTEYAALELVDRIITHMDNKEVPINIFLDLSKAFDTIDHTILLAKLRYYGIHDTALLLLKCYLNNRKQYVEFEDTKSDILPITVGVPQGSILGPLLFIIYINDFSQASSIFNFIMYADDTTLFSNLKSFGNKIQTKEYLINSELSNVIEWLNINKLSLNKSKSKYMIFHVPNKDIQYLTLKIDNVIIEKVDEFSFLGLTVGTNLNWKRHSEKICNKCTKMIGILNRLKYVLPLGIKIMLYNSLILPHINYCIMAWGYKGIRLLKIQKKVVRIITLSGYSTHSEPLFKQLNMLKIADQLRLQELKFYFKYIHKNLPAYLLDWEFISNINIHFHDTRTSSKIHTVRAKHEFAKKCLKYNLSHIINDTPAIVVEKIHTHSLRGFATYAKQFLIQKYTDTCAIQNCYSCN